MNLGKAIREARLEAGYTQEGLAKRVNVSRSLIAKYEVGLAKPDPEMMRVLETTLGLKEGSLSRNKFSSSIYLAGALHVTKPPICGTTTQSCSNNSISICFTSSFTLQIYGFSPYAANFRRKSYQIFHPLLSIGVFFITFVAPIAVGHPDAAV